MASGKTYRRGLKPAEVVVTPQQFIDEDYAGKIARGECSVRSLYALSDVRVTDKPGIYELVYTAGNTTLVNAQTRLVVDKPIKPFVRQFVSPFSSSKTE